MVDYDQLALDYARHRHVHPEVLRRLVAESGIDGRASVLEVGCGTGNYILAVQSALGCSGWGIDPSAEMLAVARARTSGVSFKVGWAERLTFPAESFDLVFSADMIHHLDDIGAYFSEGRRVLRPGGRVCTVTDSEWIIRHRQPLAEYFPETVDVDLGRYPALDELRLALAMAGFQSIREQMAESAYMLEEAQAYRDKAFSALHLIPEQAFRRGLARLELDLQRGAIPCVSRYVLLWGTNPVPLCDAR